MLDSPFKLADPLIIYKGASFEDLSTWEIKPEGGVKTPVNLTGATAHAQVRATPTSEIVLLDLSTTNGKIVLGGADGTILMQLTDEETAALDWTEGGFDLFITFSNGNRQKVIMGRMIVQPSFTAAP